jgi:thiol-disulfide isomerase/thioredoxin
MRQRLIGLLLFYLASGSLIAQGDTTGTKRLSGTIAGYASQQVFLLRYNNSRLFAYEVMDSTMTDSLGYFRMAEPAQAGMYRVCQGRIGWYSSNPGNTLHLWLGYGEDVEFRARSFDLTATAAFVHGRYNAWWFGNERAMQPLLQRLGICMQLLDLYPAGAFYEQVKQEYLRVQAECTAEWRRLAKEQPENFFLTYQRRMMPPLTGAIYRKADRDTYWKAHLLDSVDFSSPSLQASHLLGQKLEQYLELYGYPYSFPNTAALDSGLLKAVGSIIAQAGYGFFSRRDAQVKTASLQFVAAWLYNFCTEKALDNCLAYTADLLTPEVFDHSCDASPGAIETLRRMQASQRLKPGMEAPPIYTTDAEKDSLGGKKDNVLDGIRAHRTLVVFWASWCPHCQEELPRLKRFYDSTGHSDWEVLAVSIDTSQQEWMKGIAAGGYGWLNYCDLRGWESAPAKDYGVFATPQMYLLDEHRRLVGRPRDLAELARQLRKGIDGDSARK